MNEMKGSRKNKTIYELKSEQTIFLNGRTFSAHSKAKMISILFLV